MASRVRRAVLLSFAGKYSAHLIALGSILVLARLLTPVEIGVYSVGLALLAIGTKLRDFGVSNFIIQEPDLTVARLRTAFTVTFVIGWLLGGTVLLGRHWIAGFFGEPGLAGLMVLLSVSFFVMPFAAVATAQIRRDMDFGSIYWLEISSAAAQAVTAITLAAAGFSYYSLGWGSIAGNTTFAALALYLRPRAVPLGFAVSEFRRIVAFGSRSSAATLITEIGTQAPEFVIARVMDFATLGFYSRARGLVMLFHRTVTEALIPVILPYFSEEIRAVRKTGHTDRSAVSAAYLDTLERLLCLAWPFLVVLAILGYPITHILYGSQWDASVPMMRILIVGALFFSLNPLGFLALTALGAMHMNMVVTMIAQAIGLCLLAVTALIGIEAVLAGISATMALQYLCYAVALQRLAGVRIIDQAARMGRAMTAAAAAALAPLAVVLSDLEGFAADEPINWGGLLLAGIGSAAGWLAILAVYRSALLDDVMRAAKPIWQSARARLGGG